MSARATPEQALLDDRATTTLREAVATAVLDTPRDSPAEDPRTALALVLASRVAAEETARLLQASVTHARASGHSWDVIGRLLGVSRQAAQQRFRGAHPAPGPASRDTPERRVLTPLTAFSEMAVLEREGRLGWHVVEYGPLFHVVEASDHRWEHRRARWRPGVADALAAEGWGLVGETTFPWGYYTRRTDVPVRGDRDVPARDEG